MTVVYTPHTCDTPPRFRHSRFNSVPAQPSGTIWRCDCGRYWRFRVHKTYPNTGTRWRLIQSWHLISVLRILRAEARPDYLYIKEN